MVASTGRYLVMAARYAGLRRRLKRDPGAIDYRDDALLPASVPLPTTTEAAR